MVSLQLQMEPSSHTSKSTLYQRRRKQEETSKDVASQYKPYQWFVLNRCYVSPIALTKHQTYAMKAKFLDSDYKENVIVTTPRSFQTLQESQECQSIFEHTGFDRFFKLTPRSFQALQESRECQLIFEHTGFDKFFRLTPCQVDPRRCVELLSSLQEDGTCQLTDNQGKKLQVLITPETVTQALKLTEGNHMISNMKLTNEGRL